MDFISDEERNKRCIDYLDNFKSNILSGKITIEEIDFDYGYYDNGLINELNGINVFRLKYKQL